MYDLPSEDSRCRAEVDNEISGADGIFVVFDHNDGVPDISHSVECGQQFFIVPLVQANTGLVQYVNNAAEFRTHLRCEANTL